MATKMQGKAAKIIVCKYCKKRILNGECGTLCLQRQKDNQTADNQKAMKKAFTLTTQPKGWVKIAYVGAKCKDNSIPISRLVKAFGGDTAYCNYTPTSVMGVVWYMGIRYANPFWVTPQGLTVITRLQGKIPITATTTHAINMCKIANPTLFDTFGRVVLPNVWHGFDTQPTAPIDTAPLA